MSTIFFHSQKEGAAILYGTEYYYAGRICDQITLAILEPVYNCFNKYPAILNFISRDSFLHEYKSDFCQNFKTWFNSLNDNYFIIDGERYNATDITLNTILLTGSDQLKLYARLSAQCEIHAYVEGKNRQWLSDIIEKGLKDKIFRSERGWEEVIKLLKKENETPIITSYSGRDRFPNSSIAGWKDDSDEDDWYKLPIEKQWEMAIKGLRESGKIFSYNLELTPDNWNEYYFGTGLNAFDIVDMIEKIPSDKI